MSNLKIEYTPAGFDYVRRILGTRPYDEAGPIIAEMEQQRAAQLARTPEEALGLGHVPPAVLEALKGQGGASASNGAAVPS